MDHDGCKLHDARSLHAWLGIGRFFANWFRKLTSDYDFVEGQGFFLAQSGKQTGRGGSNRKDYLMTATMAKEVAMTGNTPVGRETRRYFIRMEAAAVEMAGRYGTTGEEVQARISDNRYTQSCSDTRRNT